MDKNLESEDWANGEAAIGIVLLVRAHLERRTIHNGAESPRVAAAML